MDVSALSLAEAERLARGNDIEPSEHRGPLGLYAEQAGPEHQRDQDRGGEQADADVDPGGGRGERAGERDVAERVAGEHLRAEHDEVADHPARERNRGTGEPGVADELLLRTSPTGAAAGGS